MLIFIDESGSFQIPNSNDEHAAAVVVGVVVPEVSEKALFTEYASFVATLDKSERDGSGEPKGSRISRTNRERFSEMLAGIPGVMLLPITVDLSELVGHAEKFPEQISQAMKEFAATCVHQTMRDETMVLSRQIGNLSAQEFLKLLMFTECIQECVHHAVLYLSEPPYRDYCWNAFDISIDRLVQRSTSREKQVFDVRKEKGLSTIICALIIVLSPFFFLTEFSSSNRLPLIPLALWERVLFLPPITQQYQ